MGDRIGALSIELFGRFRVRVAGQIVRDDAWESRRSADLIKLLALEPQHLLPREQVLERLFPSFDPEAGTAALHKAASHARKAIGLKEVVILKGGTVALAEAEIDLDRFRAAAEKARSSDDLGTVRAALALHGGELLPEEPYAEWIEPVRSQVRSELVLLLKRAGDFARVVALDPTDEEAHRALLQGFFDSGQRAAMERHYGELCELLRRELGARPSDETIALYRRLSKAEPVQARMVREGALLDRESDLARARGHWREAVKGRGGALLVSGEVGIGKSRFCEELLAEIAASGWNVLQGTALGAREAPPLAPIFIALEPLIDERPDLLARLPAHTRDVIEGLRTGNRHASEDKPLRGRSTIFSAITQLLGEAAREHGLVLFIDDLQDAELATLQLLTYAARAAQFQALWLLLAFRSDLQGEAARTRSVLLSRRSVHQLELGPLSDRAIEQLLSESTGGSTDRAAIDRALRLAGGNPALARELGEALGRGDTAIHSTMNEVAEARLAGLSSKVRAALEGFAVIGSEIELPELAAVAEIDLEAATRVADAASASGILVSKPPAIRFRHEIVREALTRSVPEHHRRRTHRSLAEHLENVGAPAARIAHHFEEAQERDRALPHLRRAARDALASGAPKEGIGFADRALQISSRDPEALALRAQALHAMGDPEAIIAFGEAIAVSNGAERSKLCVAQAHAAVLSGEVATAERVLANAESTSDSERAEILLVRALIDLMRGSFDSAERAALAVRDLSLRNGLRDLLIESGMLSAMVAHSRGDLRKRFELDLLDARSWPELASSLHDSYLCIMEIYLYGGEPYERISALASELRKLSHNSGAARVAAFATVLHGESELLAGHLDAALGLLGEGVRNSLRIGSTCAASLGLQRLAEAELWRGDHIRARDHLEHAHDLAFGTPLSRRHLLPRIHGALIRTGRSSDEMMAEVERAEIVIVGPQERCSGCSITLSVPAAIASARAGAIERARRHLAEAEPIARMYWPGGGWHAALDEIRGEIALAEGEKSFSVERFRAAARTFAAVGQTLDAARCAERALEGGG
jgi:DNA-binding SARP family transcriptional activator